MALRTFDFENCLGVGGFGEVYLARMTTSSGLQRKVAVKTLNREVAGDPDAAKRMRDEARLLAALNHRAVLQVHDLVNLEGRLALVTEYIKGQDLDQVLHTETLPASVAFEVVSEVAGALHAALRTRSPDTDEPMALVHRDIKPSNVRLTPSGSVKLLDFGIAVSPKIMREAKTSTGLVVGTVGYLSPDRLTSDEVLAEGDIYALGCVLYEALTGDRLYKDVSRHKLTQMAIDEQIHDAFIDEMVAPLRERLPTAATVLLEQMLAHDPHSRPTADLVERGADEVAAKLDGPSVRRWARARQWPPPKEVDGPLAGRSLSASGILESVGTKPVQRPILQPSNPTLAGYAPVEASPVRWKLMGGLAAFVGLLLLMVAGLGGALVSQMSGEAAAPGAATAASAAAPAVDPVEPPEPEPDGEATELVRGEATGETPPPTETASIPAARVPEPTVEVPKATRSSTSTASSASTTTTTAPASTPTGTLVVSGKTPARLFASGRAHTAGSVPAGQYQVQADFGSGWTAAGSATVAAGKTLTLTCSRMVMTCKVD